MPRIACSREWHVCTHVAWFWFQLLREQISIHSSAETNEMHRRNVSTHKPDLSVFWMLQQLSPSLIEKPHLWVVSGKYTCESGCSKTIFSMVLQIAISSLSLSLSLSLRSQFSSGKQNRDKKLTCLSWDLRLERTKICSMRVFQARAS